MINHLILLDRPCFFFFLILSLSPTLSFTLHAITPCRSSSVTTHTPWFAALEPVPHSSHTLPSTLPRLLERECLFNCTYFLFRSLTHSFTCSLEANISKSLLPFKPSLHPLHRKGR
ncbi:hypothetical protein BC939DRAFT_34 [Gamsiella multidivaricata]|uniref:uncharacterized protein n=1 Tax=Gamsiella multidivaricata TaxID=101098 RepID=UPI00221FCF7E|nr:uncharacterized protein BC939DRAFT_34 [Gamsiella multidivaricata]KAI7832518.1 hypothetical protein BC939DRAFT_34 [Gamsiella multidivaricata]